MQCIKVEIEIPDGVKEPKKYIVDQTMEIIDGTVEIEIEEPNEDEPTN
mgnify:CR=1 FL=1